MFSTGLIALMLLSTGFLPAGVIPGRWEKVDALSSGKPISVTLKPGDRLMVRFKSATPDSLTVVDPSGHELTLPKSQVQLITRDDDGVTDGTLTGMAAGFAAGAAFGAFIGRAFENTLGGIGIFGGISAGIGALVGYSVDRSHKESEVLYLAP